MLQYAVQLAGRDFDPQGVWKTDPTTAVKVLQNSADYDLLVWDPVDDFCEIYPQQTLAALEARLAHTAYSRLLDQMARVAERRQLPVSDQLRSRWYLVGDLAALEHQPLLNVAAALLSLTVQANRLQGYEDDTKLRLRGLADQARCWLMTAGVTPHQLVATSEPLANLLNYLLAQTGQLDTCHAGGASRAWCLANDAAVLSQSEVRVTQLQTRSAWTLIRVAALERANG
ncbi:hypothetical protein D1831_09250 [Lactiplantibacillus garii]|uniref:Uncharacterized protein n=1 Tax=Lactiplantibacillus garii TaxID=2306423 RepID=A0A3R8QQI3_9LACO|nr:hypothetical protein [Lactiplantibacillus garii]RRK10065.1 hypothetical protein D1831_09250 [Lactiplantibacillus garii]